MTELKEVLEKHRKWLTDEEGGECANLSGANLSWADLSGANLSGADLSRADLSEANLSRADLSEANLSEAIYNEHTAFFALCCPEEGSFVGYKKAGGKIVKLQIPKIQYIVL